ncbi:MAG: TRAP transporter substrate-binding protein DctP [Burkholderiaceae bacterium]
MRQVVFALLSSLALAATAQQTVELKYAEFSPDREKIHNAVTKRFAAEVEKAAAGSLKIALFPNGALGRNPAQQAQLVLDGVADIAFVVPAFTPGRFPDSEVMELPGLFRDLKEATRVFTKLVIAGKIKDFGQYVPIAAWATPPFSIHSATPITSISDLKGKKVRAAGVMQSDALKALGAVPVAVPPTEVPEAIARKTIDAATSQPAVLRDFGYDRVTHSDYFVRLGVAPLVVLMNKDKYESLPQRARDAISSHAMQWMADLYVKEYGAYNDELVESLKKDPKRKAVFPGQPDQQAAGAAFQPVIASWINRSPRNGELFKAVTAELERVRAGE